MINKTNGNGKYIYFSQIKSDVLKYIGKYIKEKSYSPTQIEIAKKFRFSRSRAGKISRAFNKEYPVHDRQM